VRRALEADEPAGILVATGARVLLSGRDIARRPGRHYLGRLFSTVASFILRAAIYDTQCGAKFFRDGAVLREALSEPFRSRWAFDVELLGRLLVGAPGVPGVRTSQLVEVPLRRWVDVRGSKLGPGDMVRAGFDLLGIQRALSARRQAVQREKRRGEGA
jgi:dolichyl-phosphate beta-glucosyltransferase